MTASEQSAAVVSTTVRWAGGERPFYYRKGSSDDAVITQMLLAQDYDLRRLRRWPEIAEFLAARATRGDRPLIVDAGANIGASSVYFAVQLPRAQIVAIEPAESNYKLLCRNTVGLRVRCLKAALAAEPGRAIVRDPGIGFWGFMTEPTTGDEGVPCVTVDELYEGLIGSQVFPFIVKIDIEGGEKPLFDKNTDWVARTPIVIIELHDSLYPKSGVSRPFLQCVAASDRDFITMGENIFSIARAL
jgi:FkbM family methyltransferase